MKKCKVTSRKTDREKFLASPGNSFFQILAIYLVIVVWLDVSSNVSCKAGLDSLEFEILGKIWSVSCNQLEDNQELVFVGWVPVLSSYFNFSSSLTTIAHPAGYIQGHQWLGWTRFRFINLFSLRDRVDKMVLEFIRRTINDIPRLICLLIFFPIGIIEITAEWKMVRLELKICIWSPSKGSNQN